MKLHEQVKEVSTSGHKSDSSFRIATSAKAFKILSDGIYSDKVTAIIRELSTNANDSHTESGQEKPFDLHLPTRSEPWFSVRDYGTGMSKEKIEDLYTTYFDSDRNTSDEFTGALGLGSKSPFSYTDNFTVESYINGEKFLYSCHIDSYGTPKVNLLLESETSEENGIEVKFSVAEHDFREFERKASGVFYAFNQKPNLTGQKIDFHEKLVLHSGKYWEVVRQVWGFRNQVSLAIMGNVAYPINTDPFADILTEEENVLLNNSSIDIYFEIGELDVSASRESLSYDETTIKNIKNKTSKIVKEINQMFSKEANKAKNYWEAVKLISQYTKTFNNGVNVPHVVSVVNYRNSPIRIGRAMNFNTREIVDINHYHRDWSGRIKKDVETSRFSVSFGVIPLVVVNDEKDGTCARKVRSFLKNNDFYDKVYVIKKNDWKKKYQKDWNNIHVKYSTEIPKPVYKKGSRKNYYQDSFVDLTNEINFKFFSSDKVDFSSPHYYVEIKNKKFIFNDSEIDFNKYLNFLKTFDLLRDSKIYGIKTVEMNKKAFKESNLINLCEFVNNKVEDLSNKYKHYFEDYYIVKENNRTVRVWGDFFSKDFAKKIKKSSSSYFTTLEKFESIREKAKNLKDESDKILLLIAFGVSFEKPDDIINLEDCVEKFSENYPLLRKVSRYEYTSQDVINYINAMDAFQ